MSQASRSLKGALGAGRRAGCAPARHGLEKIATRYNPRPSHPYPQPTHDRYPESAWPSTR
eukprot:scaffold5036_cov61-Phaeocystis_antarctica.AAC.2